MMSTLDNVLGSALLVLMVFVFLLGKALILLMVSVPLLITACKNYKVMEHEGIVKKYS